MSLSLNNSTFDSFPLRFAVTILNDSVFEVPGFPTMMRGVRVIVHAIVANMFSLSATVSAIQLGKISCLVNQLISSSNAFENEISYSLSFSILSKNCL